ncbi:MAG: hypothetical protein JSU66_11890 [Deltaproteobacteria bacterium]|nr:MAG: hypothetical protein JSU66_11890 [Deltaproteobacteria bacterium]
MHGRSAIETERRLAAAGFQMKLADTPEKRARLQGLAQRELVVHRRGGSAYVVYADAKYCGCLYAGTALAYQRYRKLLEEPDGGAEPSGAPVESAGPPLDWVAWGPWGPWW